MLLNAIKILIPTNNVKKEHDINVLILFAELQTSKRKGINIDIPSVVIKIPRKKKIILKFNIFNYNLSFQENKTANKMGDIASHSCLIS